MKKIKKKIFVWLIKKFLKNEEAIENLEYSIYLLVHQYYQQEDLYDTVYKDRRIDKLIFNAKYREEVRGADIPYNLVQEFYAQAGKGDRSFYTHYFYKILRLNNDSNLIKLKYKLKRNER